MAINNPPHPFVWKTVHETGNLPTMTHNGVLDRDVPGLYNRHNDSATVIQQKLKDALDGGQEFRAIGASWSLNEIPYSPDNIFYNLKLNIVKQVEDRYYADLDDELIGKLFFIECGARVKKIQERLWRKKRLSLKTCGASNGQSVAGAMSTGVHGAAIDFGSIQDFIVGINLITGPNPEDILYIERDSRHYLNERFAKVIKARMIRSDRVFDAALVSLGSFGIIHSVIVETEDLYLLKRYVKKMPKDQALELATTLDFQNSAFVMAEEPRRRPHHFKLFINPYTDEDYVAEIMFKEPYRSNYPDPVPAISTTFYPEASTFLGWLFARVSGVIPKLIKALESTAFTGVDEPAVEGTLGEIFWDTVYRGKAYGVALGLKLEDAEKGLKVLSDIMVKRGPVPGILSMRFVKATKATLGFTRFDHTCILEVDGVPWNKTNKIINYDEFLTAIVDDFRAANIRFTLHWGKNGDFGADGLAAYMFEGAEQEWMQVRSALLTPEMGKVFSNQFLRDLKLDTHIAHDEIPDEILDAAGVVADDGVV